VSAASSEPDAFPIARRGPKFVECSLLYVSRSTIPRDRLHVEIASIVAASIKNNARADITGGLVRAGGYFAQLLEGPTDAVKSLMARIDRDRRHADVSVVRIAASGERQLPDWSMVYSGEATYVARQIAALLGAGRAADAARIDRLTALIVSFASYDQVARGRAGMGQSITPPANKVHQTTTG